MAAKDYAHKYWRCRACQQMVNLDIFRCGCTESPSPWEPVDAPESKPTDIIGSLIFWIFLAFVFLPGLWLSYPLFKMGILMPKEGAVKRHLGECVNFIIVTLLGSSLFWIAFTVVRATLSPR